MFFTNSESTETDHKDLSKKGQIANFRKNAKQLVDYICDYTTNIGEQPIYPGVQPGFLRELFPEMPPEEPEDFDTILKDYDEKVAPGIMHWRHPDFYAYLNCGNALPNILGDMLSTACGGVGFSWTAQPAMVELENIMMDWLGRALNLPKQFLFVESNGKGGGCTQSSASDSIFNCVLAARYTALKALGCYSTSNSTTMDDPVHPAKFMDKLICYTSTESHSCVEKAANLAMVEMRLLKPNQDHQITGEILERAIIEDKKNGRIPFFFSGIVGSTGLATTDDNASIGPVCQKYKLWFHVDGAYGGSAFLLPEMAHLLKGIEYADSIDINPYKLMLGAIDSGCLWLRDTSTYKQPWLIDAIYLIDKSEFDTVDLSAKINSIDYRHYGIPLSHRFRALKLYFVFRSYGIKGLQAYQRNVLSLAKFFESLVRADDRFVVTSPAQLGVFCFRQKGPIEKQLDFNYLKSDCAMSHLNRLNMNLLYRINKSRKIHMCPYIFNGLYHLRISINFEFATEEDIRRAWRVIQSYHVTELDEEWQADRKKKSPAEEKRDRQLKSQLSFVDVIEGSRETSTPHLQAVFGRFSVCEDTDERDSIFRN